MSPTFLKLLVCIQFLVIAGLIINRPASTPENPRVLVSNLQPKLSEVKDKFYMNNKMVIDSIYFDLRYIESKMKKLYDLSECPDPVKDFQMQYGQVVGKLLFMEEHVNIDRSLFGALTEEIKIDRASPSALKLGEDFDDLFSHLYMKSGKAGFDDSIFEDPE